jgi:hypothetical protein
MSISATSDYMSSASIEAWMEQKTSSLYQQMGDAMDSSNRRADAETALNDIKAKILATKDNGGNAGDLQAEINTTLQEYKDLPEVTKVLQLLADKLAEQAAPPPASPAPSGTQSGWSWSWSGSTSQVSAALRAALQPPVAIKVSSDEADAWSKSIGDTVDGFSRQDQLGMINIQEFNSEINQAKQIASALMDSSSKTNDNIISHIG